MRSSFQHTNPRTNKLEVCEFKDPSYVEGGFGFQVHHADGSRTDYSYSGFCLYLESCGLSTEWADYWVRGRMGPHQQVSVWDHLDD